MNKGKIYKAVEEKVLKEMKECEGSGIDYPLSSIAKPLKTGSFEDDFDRRYKEEACRLSVSNKFRCPFCDEVYHLSESVVVQTFPHFLKDSIIGYFTGKRKMISTHVDRVTFSYDTVYVRKCKKCAKYYNSLVVLSVVLLALFNVLFYIFVAKEQEFDQWVFQAFFFIFSLLVFPAVFLMGGKRVHYDETKAFKYDAIRPRLEYLRSVRDSNKKGELTE